MSYGEKYGFWQFFYISGDFVIEKQIKREQKKIENQRKIVEITIINNT